MYSKIAILGSLMYASVAAKDPFYLGKCIMESDDGVTGKVILTQKGTADDEGEPTRVMRANIRGIPDGVEAISLDFYDEHPMEVEDQEPFNSLGEWFTNRRQMVNFGNMLRDDLCLKEDDVETTLDGKFIAVTCLESGNIVGCCQIEISQKGDHEDDDEE
ncbi:MAG: hypothetical protein GY786_03480 [Proteobacteria bacterium]|nr:hypothetical protein [Pseudomonadota bacterium]